MDTTEVPTPEQNVAFLHENGELQEARNAEAAAKLCPFLGKMSLEEVGLLLELQTIGHAVLEDKSTGEPEQKLSDEEKSESLFSQVFGSTESASTDKISKVEHAQTEEVLAIPQEFTQQKNLDAAELTEQQYIVVKSGSTRSTEITNHDTPQTIATEASPHISIAREVPVSARVEAPQKAVATVAAEQNFEPQHNEVIRAPLRITSASKPAAYRPPRPLPIAPSPASSINTAPPKFPAENPIDGEVAAAVDTEQRISLEVSPLPIAYEAPINEHESETVIDTFLPETPEISELGYFLRDEVPETPAIAHDLLQEIESSDASTKQRAIKIIQEIIAAPVSLEALGEEIPIPSETQLEQLVAELLVTLTIECSPQDFKSYVAAIRTYLLEEAEAAKIEQDNAIRRLSREIGTNEFLDQIQQYFVPARSKNSTLSSIGKSILHLYERIAPVTAS